LGINADVFYWTPRFSIAPQHFALTGHPSLGEIRLHNRVKKSSFGTPTLHPAHITANTPTIDAELHGMPRAGYRPFIVFSAKMWINKERFKVLSLRGS